MKKFLLCLLLSVLVGCATYGKPITDDAISSIKIGETTAETVRAMFGEPISKVTMADGSVSYTWGYYDANMLTNRQESRAITVEFKEGVVVNYGITDGNDKL